MQGRVAGVEEVMMKEEEVEGGERGGGGGGVGVVVGVEGRGGAARESW